MMKKGFGKGFCSGILVAALTVGLGAVSYTHLTLPTT